MWYKKDSAGHCWLWQWKKPQAKERRQPPETGKGKKTDFPWSLHKEPSPANTLILAQWNPFQTSDLQNYRIIHLCCFKPLKFVVICVIDAYITFMIKTQIQIKSWKAKHILLRSFLPIRLWFSGRLPHQSPLDQFGHQVSASHWVWIPTAAIGGDRKRINTSASRKITIPLGFQPGQLRK